MARGIVTKYGGSPLALCDITLLLPNRRSCRTVQEAFLRITGGVPTLLPKMQPLGDVGDEDFIFKTSLGNMPLSLPPVISPTRQRLLLAKLIEKFQSGYISKNKISTAQSVNLATELGKFLDEVQRQQLSFDRLHEIVPQELAKHWQVTLDFMDIIIRNWPEILAEKGANDSGTHRNLVIAALADFWKQNPPDKPVIAAGSTGSIPATAKLLKVIASLPLGAVILPGVDLYMDDDSWENISDSHPQSGLKTLLDNFGIKRSSIKLWHGCVKVDSETVAASPLIINSREKLISQLMLPAKSADKWQNIKEITQSAVAGICVIETANLQEEAKTIALLMRSTLEEKGKTAALVTADQNLAQRLTGIMQKWGIALDNSSGTALHEVAPCVFVRLVAKMVAEEISPISLLACMKHPMARFGMGAAKFKNNIREIEKNVLRGIRVEGGFAAIGQILLENGKAELAAFLDDVANAIKPLACLMQSNIASLQAIVEEHIKLCENLAQTDEISGAQLLWGGDSGQELRAFFDELLEASGEMKKIEPSQYCGIFDALLAGKTYRPKYGSHARLSILSPMEARMQSFDLCILGSMNEGSWPPIIECGPWMSRPMRQSFGLPLPEKQIGQSAHDFVQAFNSPEIVLTRSRKVDGTATIPSRWLMRLEAVLGIFGKETLIASEKPFTTWAKQLDEPESAIIPCQPPAPTPPEDSRPLELSVTSVEKLMRDPYSYYAAKILRLKKLDNIDMEPSGREFGDIIHKVIDGVAKLYDNIPHEGRLQFMLDSWKILLDNSRISQNVRVMWQPKFEKIAAEFIKLDEEARQDNKIFSECSGEYKINLTSGKEFTITARADRLQKDCEGNITIIDYKTKSTISNIAKNVFNGTLPQMPLEALIAQNGGFKDVGSGKAVDMQYWFMNGGNDKESPIKQEKISEKILKHGTVAELLKVTGSGIAELVAVFTDSKTPYKSCPDPDKKPEFNDYEHLARINEW